MRIDVHNHAAPEALVDYVRSTPDLGFVERTGGPLPPKRAGGDLVKAFSADPLRSDPKAKLRQLDEQRIDAAIVSMLPTVHGYDLDPDGGEQLAQAANRGLHEYAAAAPDRLRWMAHLPLGAPDRIAGVLAAASELGAAGIAVGTFVGPLRLDAPAYEPLWAEAARLKLPVFVHPNYPWTASYPGLDEFHLQNVLGHPLETTITVERLICAGVLDRHPQLHLVLAHAGGYFPYQAGRLRHATTVRPELAHSPADPWAYRGQVSVDTIAHDREALVYAIARMGADNVLLGTDMPADMATPDPIGTLEAVVDAGTVHQITELNPLRLYGFGG
jgi:aminocarboxymuconate-semialdehyde decarboxylase